jgi:cytochrome c-type biogenesis protein CcmH/NrfG
METVRIATFVTLSTADTLWHQEAKTEKKLKLKKHPKKPANLGGQRVAVVDDRLAIVAVPAVKLLVALRASNTGQQQQQQQQQHTHTHTHTHTRTHTRPEHAKP